MGFLKQIKFWKKRSNNTPTKVDECVCTEDPRTCNATVSMDPTVMCAAYTQTETRMDGGGAAAKQEYERELQMNNQKIRELEEELAVSNRLTSELMLNVNSVQQQVREYMEKPVINWSDDCECRQQISAVGDLLRKFIITERDAKKSKPEVSDAKKSKSEARDTKKSKPEARDAKKSKPEVSDVKKSKPEVGDAKKSKPEVSDVKKSMSEARDTKKSKPEARDTKKSKPEARDAKKSKPEVSHAKKSKSEDRDTKKSKPEARDAKKTKPEATSGRTYKVDSETQTEANTRQRDCADADERETLRRLEDKNRKLFELVKDYERKIAALNEEMEHIFQDRKCDIHHIKMRYKEEYQRQLLKMRDMRDELLWYTERLPGIRMPTALNG